MRFTYQQFGTVALISENGKPLCVAKLDGGLWQTETFPDLIGGRPALYDGMGPGVSDRSLDQLVERINRAWRRPETAGAR